MGSKKHAFLALHELGKETVAAVEARLMSGEAASSVARWMQEELGVFLNLQRDSLKKNLKRYRSIDLRDKVVTQIVEKTAGKNIAGVKKRVMAMDELEQLVAIQKSRFEKVHNKELTMSDMLLKTVSDEAKLLRELLVDLGRLQLETGILPRAPKRISGETYDPATGERKQFEWTEEQAKLFETLEGAVIPEAAGLLETHEHVSDA